MTSLGIYIHIPFCIQKCLYCDFLSFPKGRAQQALYFDALKKEISIGAVECREYEVVSVFFGGGTPTSVEPGFIEDIMGILEGAYNLADDAEITIECNPGTADFEALKRYRKAGINRISIGLQSAKDEELKRLGRIHDRQQFEECYQSARAAGFQNINIDLMSALPGQSLLDWEENLRYACSLNPKPEHISAYSLIVEEGTPFYDMELDLPDEETERDMYHHTKEILMENGYHQYEISNYALNGADVLYKKAGTDSKSNAGINGKTDAGEQTRKTENIFECRHNKRYWQGGDYIGFGLGAASLMKGRRFHNVRDFRKYLDVFSNDSKTDWNTICATLREDIEELDEKARMEEFMFLGLRMTCGVSDKAFCDKFGKEIRAVYSGVIDELISDKLMVQEEDIFRLTDKGLDLSNYCMAKFLL